MQQGGAPSVFAPNPQPYRAPLQGLNPNVFQYDVRTQPLDTTNLIQVMQTKDTMDIRREQAALEREKMKADADLAKMKFEHQKAKAQSDFNLEMMKGSFNKFSGISNPIPFEDYTMSNRFKNQYEPIVNEMRAAEQEAMDMVTTTPFGDPMFLKRFNGAISKIDGAKKKLVPLEWFKLDQAGYKKANSLLTAPKGDDRVNPAQFMRNSALRGQYLNEEVDNGYKANFATDPALVYNEKTEAKKFEDAIDFYNTPRKTTEYADVIIDKYNQFKQVTKDTVLPNSGLAAELWVDKILADPKQASYVSSRLGIDIHDPSIKLEDKKKVLIGLLKPELDFADKLLSSIKNSGESYLVKVDTPDRPKPDVNINYNIKGKSYTVDKNYSGEANFNFKHSGAGSKAGATKKEKDQFEAQVNNNTAQILQDNMVKDSDNKMIDIIADAVRRTASKYPNLTDYAPNDIIQKAWSDAIANYNALPAGEKTDRALDIEFEKALKTNYEVDLTEVGKKNEEMNEYERLAKNLKSTSTWQDLKKSDSPLVKDSKGNLKPDNQLQLIFSAIRGTAAQLNMGKTDLNAAPQSVKSQLQNKKGSFNLSEYYPQN